MYCPGPNFVTIGLSHLYGALVYLRQSLYRCGLLSSTRLPVPVIVVGNVLAGGVGKTPFCIQLIAYLQKLGYSPGLVARGYKRKSKGIIEVASDASPAYVGDEAWLIRYKTGVPAVVGTNRVKAAHMLLRRYPKVNVIVSDDGLQHYALARDIEVVLHDERLQTSHHLLPAGWLREPWPRQRVGKATEIVLENPERILDCSKLPKCDAYAAVAGIGRPERFFDALRGKQHLQLVQTLALPDHDTFARGGVFDQWQQKLCAELPLLCTEKDAPKIASQYPNLVARLYAVPLTLSIPANVFTQIEAALLKSI